MVAIYHASLFIYLLMGVYDDSILLLLRKEQQHFTLVSTAIIKEMLARTGHVNQGALVGCWLDCCC